MDRRSFLVSGLAAASGLTAEARPSAAKAGRRISIGVLGAVYSHAEAKIRILRNAPDWKLVGVCESDPEVRAAHPEVPFLTEQELLARSEVVAVESDVTDHARHGKLVLEAGKHLHLEKPPAITLEEFSEIINLAQKRNLLLQVGYMWRYNPGMKRALEAATNGWLGDVYLVRGLINNQLPARRRPEWARFHGGVMFELGSHLIDALVRLQGRPEKVHSVLRTDGQFADSLADNTVAVFEFPRCLGIITAATLQPNAGDHRFFEIQGTNGTAMVEPLQPPQLVLDLAEAAGPYRTGTNRVDFPPYERYIDDFNELAAAVREKKPLSVSPEQELLVQETLIRATQRKEAFK